jgi:ribosome-associated heat shock protein Hsp15
LDRQRIDRWLWHARLVRTRTAASALVAAGRVRVNGERIATASRKVGRGDVITVVLGRLRVLKVLNFCERRGDARMAQSLYEELAPPAKRSTGLTPPAERSTGSAPARARGASALDKPPNDDDM